MTQGHGLCSLCEKVKSSESKSGRGESSQRVHPWRESRPGSIGSFVVDPSAPSRVRVVPWRLPESDTPGCHVTCLPSRAKEMARLSGVNSPELPVGRLYESRKALVLIWRNWFVPDFVTDAKNFGTGNRRLRKTNEA